jgi:hypothetical protein
MGVIGIVIASLVNLFLRSSGLDWMISIIGVGVFAGLTAYDTRRIKGTYHRSDDASSPGRKAVMGDQSLYLNFINLFMLMLRLTGNRRLCVRGAWCLRVVNFAPHTNRGLTSSAASEICCRFDRQEAARPRRSRRSWTMRRKTAEFDSKQREVLLYLADLGTAIFSAGLAVAFLELIVDLI